ncbi:MAG: phosphogluconate dehydratase [Lysobacterales bacterium]
MIHQTLERVTERVSTRSAGTRADYLQRMQVAADKGSSRGSLSCGNLAHGIAAEEASTKEALSSVRRANVGIITAFNDMLSAHQPYGRYPDVIKSAAWQAGGVAQVAGGVPAMCDGVTQGQPGMELSLFSRDVIAMATAVSLSHNMFDAVVALGICDKIVPGLLIGSLAFGHLPLMLIPAGPMPSGIPNAEKARVRQLYAEGKVSREELLKSESASYHSPGTCTFYGTANTNQLMMEFMGLQLPGSSFVNPATELREALTRAATARAVNISANGESPQRLAHVVSEKSLINAIVGLLASGGSTNHLIHLVAIGKAAGIVIDWDDFDALSAAVPLLARVYPNGQADVNHFHAAGGVQFMISELLDAGLLHDDVETVAGKGLHRYRQEAFLDGDCVVWKDGASTSHDTEILRGCKDPFDTSGGMVVLRGNIGRGAIKVSAVKPEHRVIEAPVRVFQDQTEVVAAFDAGELERDVVVVVTHQGPRSNGMPELHKLTPILGVLQDRGFKVALVTDGRMSGASGKVPAAIHVHPEAVCDGNIGRLRDGDVVRLDGESGVLEVLIETDKLAARKPVLAAAKETFGMGRELFAAFRERATDAESGGSPI